MLLLHACASEMHWNIPFADEKTRNNSRQTRLLLIEYVNPQNDTTAIVHSHSKTPGYAFIGCCRVGQGVHSKIWLGGPQDNWPTNNLCVIFSLLLSLCTFLCYSVNMCDRHNKLLLAYLLSYLLNRPVLWSLACEIKTDDIL